MLTYQVEQAITAQVNINVIAWSSWLVIMWNGCLLCCFVDKYGITSFLSFLMLIILIDSYLGRTHELDVPLS